MSHRRYTTTNYVVGRPTHAWSSTGSNATYYRREYGPIHSSNSSSGPRRRPNNRTSPDAAYRPEYGPTHTSNNWSSTVARRRCYNYSIGGLTFTLCDSNDDRVPEPDPIRTLVVRKVDLNVKTNGSAHHTDEYDISDETLPQPKLVVRRGQPFDISIVFNRCYDPVNDDLKIVLQAGDQPMASKGTHVDILLSAVDKPNDWGAKILSNDGPNLTVTIFTKSSMYVGKWTLRIEVVEKDVTSATNNTYSYVHPDPVYFIFNPWCKSDSVYMDNESHLQEYVMNEFGRLYLGTTNSMTSKPWTYGQFTGDILDVALYLLEVGGLRWNTRGNPIAVVRKLTAMVNDCDDNGVLAGNWSGSYSGGRNPQSWTGSPAILQRFWDSREPVLFGQCWVFSGVATTLMRALGIPARSVTNFESAHDTDGSITIDVHVDSQGEPVDPQTSEFRDSVWNFHVWNEVWMARPDLPIGFGGWQVVDATPQETSDGVYVCGPVSVEAIRQGEVNLPYDAPFVFAEVNADKMYWKYNDNGDMEPIAVQKYGVGKYISTKSCGTNEREDVTLQYKPPEGSAEERASVKRANQMGSTLEDKWPNLYGEKTQDMVFTVEHDTDRTWVGSDFVVGLRMKNASSRPRTVKGRIVVKTMYYTGVACDKLKSEPMPESLVLKPGKEIFHKVTVKPNDYLEHLKDGCMMDASFMIQVVETGQVFATKERYRLRKPHLTIKAPKETRVGEQFKVDLSFVNPLDKTLTDCVVEVDGLARDLSIPQSNVGSKGTFSTSIPVTASKKGQKELIVIFRSAQLEDINGAHDIFVRSAY